MSNHPTRLNERLNSGEIEIVTQDPAVQHKASQARLNQTPTDFVYWTGGDDEIVEGIVTSIRDDEPFRFSVRPQMKDGATKQDARATENGAGPHDKPELATDATQGTGMLAEPGTASDNDMAPGG